MYLVGILICSGIWFTLTGVLVYALCGWYVRALLWLAKPQLTPLRIVGSMLLYFLSSVPILCPLGAWFSALRWSGQEPSASLMLPGLGMYVLSMLPAFQRFGRNRGALREAGYKP